MPAAGLQGLDWPGSPAAAAENEWPGAPVDVAAEWPGQPEPTAWPGQPAEFAQADEQAEIERTAGATAPQWARNAAEAGVETLAGFIPRSVGDVAHMLTPAVGSVEEVRKGIAIARDVAGGKLMEEATREHMPEAFVLADADQTPALSKERFKAGFEVAAQALMGAGIAKGLKAKGEPSSAKATAGRLSNEGPLKSFDQLPADLVPDSQPSTINSQLGTAPFLSDPAVPFMTKVRIKERLKQQGLDDAAIDAVTTAEAQVMIAETGNRRPELVEDAGVPIPPEMKANIERVMSVIPDSVKRKIEALFADDKTAKQVAKELGMDAGIVRKLRTGMGIPARTAFGSPAITPEFTAWKAARENAPARRTTTDLSAEAVEAAKAEAQYREELMSEANAAQSANGKEILEAIADAGGLPSRNSPVRESFAGEIRRLDEIARDPQRVEKIPLNKLFREDAPHPDELATRLRDQGFDVQTPGDLFNLAEERLSTGRPRYGTPAAAEAYASRTQATLPGGRVISPSGLSTLNPQLSTAPPRSLADIRKYLSAALDIPIRMGTNVAGGVQGAFGLYRVKPQTIRMRALNDIPTIAHEVGHDLHHIVFTDPATGGPSAFLWGFDGELKPLGRVTSKPNAPPEMVRMEGVAEFTREWLTDRAQAIAKAPTFTAHFETTLKAQHPEILQILESAREQLRAYIDQPGWEKAKSMIRWDQPKENIPWRDRLEKLYTNWFNELRPIDRAMNKLVELGLDPAQAREVSQRAINYRGGWRGKADHDLRFEQTDLNGQRRGKSLHEILGGVEDARDFDTYVALKRAQEKMNQGKKTGFEDALNDPETHRRLRDMAALYETRRQDLIKYSEGLMGNMEQSGFFTSTQLGAMRAANKDYVPFHRIYEAVTGESIGPRGGGDGLVNTHSGVMKFKGSDLQIGSPIEAVIKNTYMFRDLAERNRISSQFVDAVDATTGGGRVAESVLKPMKPTRITAEEMMAKLKDIGLEAEAQQLSAAGVDLATTIFRAADGVSAKDGTFSVWKDGKQKLYQLGDEALLRSLTLADSADAMLIQKMPGFRPAAWITDKLRTGATLSLEFIARNAVRDPITAAVFSRNGFVPLFDSARGIFSVFKKDQWYRDWMKEGGSHSGLYDSSARNVQEALREVIKEPTALSQAADLANPLNIIKNLGRASSLIEESTRVSEYRRAIERGKSPLEAANDAKDVTLNFSRYGVKGKVVNQISAFFNAGLQDFDKIVRAHREAPMRTATKAFMYITAPSILAWYLGKDDKRIQTLPEWRKSYFWNVNLGSADDPEAFVLSVPKPFLMGAIYGTGAEKALDYISGRDENAIYKWGAALMQNTFVRSDLVIATNALKPLVETIANYSFFTKQPLVSQGQQALETGLQFNPQTSETAKFVGPLVGLAPVKVDNLVRGYLGGLGTMGVDAIDWFMVKTGLVTPAARPEKSWRELPGVRAFFGSPYAANEYTGRFYKAMDVAEERLKTFDAYGNRLMSAEQKRYWDANKNEIVWYKAQVESQRGNDDKAPEMITVLRRTRDYMSDIGKAMIIVQNRRDITPAEKRRMLIELKTARDQIAQFGFDTYIHPVDRRKVF